MALRDLAAALGRAIGQAMPTALASRIRAHYAATYGTCDRCGVPLAGPSPTQTCEPCHADATMGALLGGVGQGDVEA